MEKLAPDSSFADGGPDEHGNEIWSRNSTQTGWNIYEYYVITPSNSLDNYHFEPCPDSGRCHPEDYQYSNMVIGDLTDE